MAEETLDLDGVEDAYPLTPAQSGMLFHTLSEPGSGVYIGCYNASLPEDLNLEAFRNAWAKVALRHQALRTIFVWESLDAPVQVVLEDPRLKWEEARWPEAEEDQRALLEETQQGGVDPAAAPSTRFVIFHDQDRPYHFAWISHHASIDAWSAAQVMAEVARLYAELTGGAEAVLDEAMPFRDFVDWTVSADVDAAKAYWLSAIGDYVEPAQIQLPAPDTAVARTGAQTAVAFRLEEGKTQTLLAQARALRVTPNAILNVLWGIVLHRLSGQDDVAFGLAVTQRPPELPGVETAIGNFVTTIPARIDVTSEASLRALIQRGHTTLLEARQHATLSLNDIRALTALPAHAPFLETIVSVETAAPPSAGAGTLFADPSGRDRSNFPLSVLFEIGTDIQGKILFDTNRFTTAQATFMAGMLCMALETFSTQLDLPATELTVLDAEAANAAAEGLAGAPLSPHRLFLEDILAHAGTSPERIALVSATAQITYGALEHLTAQCAKALVKQGISAGQRVVLFAQREPMAIVGMLAILRAGCSYVPINAANRSERADDILQTCGAAAIVTTMKDAADLPTSDLPVLVIDQPPVTTDAVDLPTPAPDDAAYVLYTSGSTGKPKGVVVSHGNLAASTAARGDFYPQAPESFLLLSSVEFDSSVVGIYWTLTTGGTLVLPAQGAEQDVQALSELIESHHVTDLLCLPSVLELLFIYAPQERLTSLRTAISAGEELSERCHHAWQKHASHVRLYNEYGPTEATVWCVACEVPPASSARRLPIGAPIPGATLYLRDAHGRPVPGGLPGELWVGGPGIAQGYLNNADLTADRFVTDPSDGTKTLYRTGDLVRLRQDGLLDYLGRMDQQVKIRGHRVELGEIEAALSARDEIASAAVIDYFTGQDTRLAAFLVLEHRATLAPDALRTALREKLPDWMLPHRYVVLADMPKTATGKIDRNALVLPAEEAAAEVTAPRTELERDLAAIWKDVLWLDREIGLHDDFAALGGHSLLSMRLVNEIETRLGKRLPLAQIGRLTTIADQAEKIEQLAEPTPDAPASAAAAAGSGLFEGLNADQLSQMHAYMAGWPGEPLWDGSMYRALNTAGTKPPLFWCFNWGQEFAALAAALGPDQPIYGTRSGHLVLDVVPETQQWDNRRVAMQSVHEVLKVQPEGPYYLGGNCQGAAIAMETAQVLHGLAKPVGLVMMMEAFTEHAFHGRVALLFGDRSDMNPYALSGDPEALWNARYLHYSVDTIRGGHGQFFNEQNIKQLSYTIDRRLTEARSAQAPSMANSAALTSTGAVPETPGHKEKVVAEAVAALVTQAQALAEASAISEAVAMARAALALEPESFAALKQLGLLHVAQQESLQAEALILRALAMQEDPQLRVALAQVQKQARKEKRLRYKLRSNLKRITGRT